MTPTDSDPVDDGTDDSDEAVETLVDVIRSVLESLSKIESEDGRREEAGHIERGSTRIDYQYDVSVGLDDVLNDADGGEWPGTEPTHTIHLDAEAPEPSYVVRVYETDETIRVVADLPGIDEGDVNVSLAEAGDRLELSVAGDVIESVPLRWGETTLADVTFTNQILEVTLRRNNGT